MMKTRGLVLAVLGIAGAGLLLAGVAADSPAGADQRASSAGTAAPGAAPGAATRPTTRPGAAALELRVQELVRKLGDPDFATRERATNELVGIEEVLPLLDKVASNDPEVVSRIDMIREKTKNAQKSATQIRAIVTAAILWTDGKPNDSLPPDLGLLIVEEELGMSPALLLSPISQAAYPADIVVEKRVDKVNNWINANSSYVYLGKGKRFTSDGKTILVYEKPEFAIAGMINIGYGDVHVERKSVAEALAEIAKQEGSAPPVPAANGDKPKTPPPPSTK